MCIENEKRTFEYRIGRYVLNRVEQNLRNQSEGNYDLGDFLSDNDSSTEEEIITELLRIAKE